MLAPAAPHEVVARVNAELCVDNAHGMFVTLFLGVLDPASGALAFCNAGHNPPYLVNRAGGVVPIQGPRGKPLGIRPTFAYQTGELRLAPEERLFLFTDGITEAMDAAGELFGEERLEAALRSHSGAPAEAMVREVVGAVRAFAGTAPQADDIAALALRLARLNWLERRLASRRADLPRVGELVDELAVAHRLPPAALVDLRIALDEVVANIVEHGRAREIRLRLGVHDGLLEAIVEDDGTPFDPRTAPPPDLDRPLAERRVGGLGLHFVRNLIAEVDYSSRPGVNRLVLRQPLTTTTPRENDGSA
jgi:sigma-B regulation protein RsbU (phosphoserine phosphatase)